MNAPLTHRGQAIAGLAPHREKQARLSPVPAHGSAGLAGELAIAVIVFALTLTGLFHWNMSIADPPFEEIPVVLSTGTTIMVARYEITHALWRQCHEADACDVLPKPGRRDADGTFPVTDINWLDAGQFVAWINATTGLGYRLPTLDEWREIAGVPPGQAKRKLFDDPRLAWAADYGTSKIRSRRVKPSGHFGFARSGVADIAGNVWEWTSTCVAADLAHCPAYYAAGEGHMAEIPVFLRDAYGGGCSAGIPPANLGLRLVRDL
ncbi:MAG: formylglycine-generating enzyme family protein [Salaquimonas sp.]|nr:formylglycine-generating enzyme family protein [Salaquimonas sp.]